MNVQSSKKRTLNQLDIISEIKLAEKERRAVDLSSAIISDLSLISDTVKEGLNLENSEIKGSVFLGEVVVLGELNLKNSTINGSLYLGNSEIDGDLILENAIIKGSANLVGVEVKRNIYAKKLTTQGFLSLSKARIGGDVILEDADIKSAQYEDLSIRGDLFLDSAIIKGSLDLGKIKGEGIIDMENVKIGANLILTGAKSGKGEINVMSTKLEGKKII